MTQQNTAAEDRTVEDDRNLRRLINELEQGDEILWVTGSMSGSDERVEALEVAYAEEMTRYEDGETVETDRQRVTVEGPRGGDYSIVEADAIDRVVASVHYSGKQAALEELTLVRRDGSEETARDVVETITNEHRTIYTGRQTAVRKPGDDAEVSTDDDYNWLCYVDDDGRFVATPSLQTGDLHVEGAQRGEYRRIATFADDYETFVEENAKEDVKALDWDDTHATFNGSAWKFDRERLAQVVQQLVEAEHGETDRAWTVSVPRELAETRNTGTKTLHGVPGVGRGGRKAADGVTTLEADEGLLDGEAPVDTDADEDEGQSFEEMGEQITDEETVEEAKETMADFDYDVGESADEMPLEYFEEQAAEQGISVVEAVEAMQEYGTTVAAEDRERFEQEYVGDTAADEGDDEADADEPAEPTPASDDNGPVPVATDGGTPAEPAITHADRGTAADEDPYRFRGTDALADEVGEAIASLIDTHDPEVFPYEGDSDSAQWGVVCQDCGRAQDFHIVPTGRGRYTEPENVGTFRVSKVYVESYEEDPCEPYVIPDDCPTGDHDVVIHDEDPTETSGHRRAHCADCGRTTEVPVKPEYASNTLDRFASFPCQPEYSDKELAQAALYQIFSSVPDTDECGIDNWRRSDGRGRGRKIDGYWTHPEVPITVVKKSRRGRRYFELASGASRRSTRYQRIEYEGRDEDEDERDTQAVLDVFQFMQATNDWSAEDAEGIPHELADPDTDRFAELVATHDLDRTVDTDVPTEPQIMTDGGQELPAQAEAAAPVVFDPDEDAPRDRSGYPHPAFVTVGCDDCDASGSVPEQAAIDADELDAPLLCEACAYDYTPGDRVLVHHRGAGAHRRSGTVSDIDPRTTGTPPAYVVDLDGAGEAHVTPDCLLALDQIDVED